MTDPFAGDEPFAKVCADIRAGRVRSLPGTSGRAADGQRMFADVFRNAFGEPPQPPVVNSTALYHDLVDQSDGVNLYGDHPDMRPPWEDALIGYVNEHGNAVVLATCAHRLQPDDPTPWWIEEYQPDCEVDRIEWVVNGNIVVGGRGGNGPTPTTGPLAGLWLVVYDDGTLGDIHWMDYTRPGEREREHERDSVPKQWDMALLVWMGTIKMANCANVELDDSQPNRAARRRIARTGTVVSRLVLRESVRRRNSRASGGSFVTALTSVRGHVAHYGSCCDTHPPRGLLFGKYTRKVWVPAHARGDIGTGVVEQEFVTAGAES